MLALLWRNFFFSASLPLGLKSLKSIFDAIRPWEPFVNARHAENGLMYVRAGRQEDIGYGSGHH